MAGLSEVEGNNYSVVGPKGASIVRSPTDGTNDGFRHLGT